METIEQIRLAKQAKKSINTATSDEKNKALRAMADSLVEATAEILAANQLDMEAARGADFGGHAGSPTLDRRADSSDGRWDTPSGCPTRSSWRAFGGADPGEWLGHSEETSGHGSHWDYL